MKINTKDLATVLGTITNLIKYNNIKPITNMVELYADNNVCHIGATDGITKVVATVNVEGDIDNIVLNLKDFYKLIKLTSKDTVDIKKLKDHAEMRGNGKYKLSIQVDEMGKQIRLPLQMVEHKEKTTISVEALKQVEEFHKFTLCTDENHKELSKYATINNETVASDSAIISVSDVELPYDEMDSFVVSQLCKLPNDAQCSINTNYFRFETTDGDISYTGQIYTDTIKEFPVTLVEPVLETNMYQLELNGVDTAQFIDIVKRLNIFQNAFSAPMVFFENNYVYNKDKTVEEKLIDIETDKNVCVSISIDRLLKVLKVMEPSIDIYLGESAIKVSDEHKFYIIGSIK